MRFLYLEYPCYKNMVLPQSVANFASVLNFVLHRGSCLSATMSENEVESNDCAVDLELELPKNKSDATAKNAEPEAPASNKTLFVEVDKALDFSVWPAAVRFVNELIRDNKRVRQELKQLRVELNLSRPLGLSKPPVVQTKRLKSRGKRAGRAARRSGPAASERTRQRTEENNGARLSDRSRSRSRTRSPLSSPSPRRFSRSPSRSRSRSPPMSRRRRSRSRVPRRWYRSPSPPRPPPPPPPFVDARYDFYQHPPPPAYCGEPFVIERDFGPPPRRKRRRR